MFFGFLPVFGCVFVYGSSIPIFRGAGSSVLIVNSDPRMIVDGLTLRGEG